MVRIFCGLLLSTWVLIFTGCGSREKSATIHGAVAMNGAPLPGVEVQFIPTADPSLGSHTTTTGADGTFELKAERGNPPVKPGTYVVVVNKWVAGDPSKPGGGMDGMKNEIPESYRMQATTTLKADIKDGDNALDTFQIVNKSKR